MEEEREWEWRRSPVFSSDVDVVRHRPVEVAAQVQLMPRLLEQDEQDIVNHLRSLRHTPRASKLHTVRSPTRPLELISTPVSTTSSSSHGFTSTSPLIEEEEEEEEEQQHQQREEERPPPSSCPDLQPSRPLPPKNAGISEKEKALFALHTPFLWLGDPVAEYGAFNRPVQPQQSFDGKFEF